MVDQGVRMKSRIHLLSLASQDTVFQSSTLPLKLMSASAFNTLSARKIESAGSKDMKNVRNVEVDHLA